MSSEAQTLANRQAQLRREESALTAARKEFEQSCERRREEMIVECRVEVEHLLAKRTSELDAREKALKRREADVKSRPPQSPMRKPASSRSRMT